MYRNTEPSKQKALFKRTGIRYFELSRLPYYDPIRMGIIDPMHNILLGEFIFTYQRSSVLKLSLQRDLQNPMARCMGSNKHIAQTNSQGETRARHSPPVPLESKYRCFIIVLYFCYRLNGPLVRNAILGRSPPKGGWLPSRWLSVGGRVQGACPCILPSCGKTFALNPVSMHPSSHFLCRFH